MYFFKSSVLVEELSGEALVRLDVEGVVVVTGVVEFPNLNPDETETPLEPNDKFGLVAGEKVPMVLKLDDGVLDEDAGSFWNWKGLELCAWPSLPVVRNFGLIILFHLHVSLLKLSNCNDASIFDLDEKINSFYVRVE